jgi:hypothetical protein
MFNTFYKLSVLFLILNFKLSLCSVLTVSIFLCIPSVWFILSTLKPLKMDLIEGSETSANINQTLGIHLKIETVNFCVVFIRGIDMTVV